MLPSLSFKNSGKDVGINLLGPCFSGGNWELATDSTPFNGEGNYKSSGNTSAYRIPVDKDGAY